MISTYLRAEGRIAALAGDREAAVQPRVDEVKAELARLVGEGARP
jgi:hypothetical protein